MSEHDLFLDTLSKDDREALLNKKMEEIRRKNEALQRRHAEIQADKKAAELKGIAVSLKPPPPEDEENDKSLPQMRGVRVAVEQETLDKAKTSRYSSGRGKRMGNMKEEPLRTMDKSRNQVHRNDVKLNRRSAELTRDPPPEAPRNFLEDTSRQGPLNETQVHKSTRNPRNFGGSDFANVKQQIQYERQKHRYDTAPVSKEEMEVRMTGKERREYMSWKQERDQIDHERLERQKNNKGTWKREWDIDKKEVTPPTPPASRRLEPGKRPAGRIGSGRFGLSDERNKGRDKSPTKGAGSNQTPRENQMLVIDTSTEQQRPEPRKPYHGGQRSPGVSTYQENASMSSYVQQRNHLSSEGSDDTRLVQEENNSLVIEVVNDFSGSGLDGRRGRGSSGYRGGRGGGEWAGGRGRGEYRGRGGRGEYRGSSRGDYRGGSADNRVERRGGINNRGEYGGGSRSDYRRGMGESRGSSGRGEYRGGGNRGEYRGRGGERGFRGGRGRYHNRDVYDGDEAENQGGFRGNRGLYRGRGRGGRRGGRGFRYDEEPQILGTVVIDTSVSADSKESEPTEACSKTSGGISSKKQKSPDRIVDPVDAPLSPQSNASGSWATTDSQGDWETEDEDCQVGDEFDDQLDQYEEDDYWEEGLPEVTDNYMVDTSNESTAVGTTDMKDDTVDQDDVHNSSSESLERFIQEHTLHLNVKTGNLETVVAEPTSENCTLHLDVKNGNSETAVAEPTTPEKSTSQTEVLSPFSPMKTPEGHEHVLDWGAEGSSSIESTPQKNVKENLDLSTSFSNSENNESLEKSRNESIQDELPTGVEEDKSASSIPKPCDSQQGNDCKEVENNDSKTENNEIEPSPPDEKGVTSNTEDSQNAGANVEHVAEAEKHEEDVAKEPLCDSLVEESEITDSQTQDVVSNTDETNSDVSHLQKSDSDHKLLDTHEKTAKNTEIICETPIAQSIEDGATSDTNTSETITASTVSETDQKDSNAAL